MMKMASAKQLKNRSQLMSFQMEVEMEIESQRQTLAQIGFNMRPC